MTEMNDGADRARYRLADHPWAALAIFIVANVLVLGLVGTAFAAAGLRPGGPMHQTVAHIVMLFVLTPLVLRLPKGRRGLVAYLADTGFSRFRPLVPLVVLGFSCWVILALCQGLGVVVFRLTEGKEVTLAFLGSVWNLAGALPPRSAELLVSLPSALEELAFRGVLVTLFMSRYGRNASVVIPAAAFGAMHLLNMAGDQDPTWVLGQTGAAFLTGVAYGYLFVKTRSLLPGMIMHWLGNAFVASIMAYLNANSGTGTQALYGVVFTFGLVPVVGMILWIKTFSRRWMGVETMAVA